MRALVTGATGVLGTWLRSTAPVTVTVVAATHRRPVPDAWTIGLDLRDRDATAAAVQAVLPDVVVHAAYAKDRASIVDATRHLAVAAREVGAGLVHVSTEAVFSGDGSVCTETDRPDPVSAYGAWKAEAEDVAVECCPDATVVRLPLIISADPPDHIASAIVAGARPGGERPTWFTDELRQPALAAELAPALWTIAGQPAEARAGVWHLPGPEVLSRLEIAQRTVAALDLDPGLLVGAPSPPDARRPRDIRMSAGRAEAAIGWSPSPIHT